MGNGLKKWADSQSMKNAHCMNRLKIRLDELYIKGTTDEVLGEIVDPKLALNIEIDKEELRWQQCS